jgi:ubiquinone/menaquinone biosynthesis C-methylase UbiE
LGTGQHFAAYEAAATPVPRLVEAANGVVLEVGPGSGNQFSRFDKTVISRIYGIEPNENLFNQLRNEKIKLHHLSDIYVPINAALEDKNILEEWNIGDESIDSVVCMQALFSVSDPTAAAKQIYRLLKPGGQLLFWEHTASQDWVTRQVQGWKSNFSNNNDDDRLTHSTGIWIFFFGNH